MKKSQLLGRSKIANQEKIEQKDTSQVTKSILDNNQNLITQLQHEQEHYNPLEHSIVRNTYLKNLGKPDIKSDFRQHKKKRIQGIKKQGLKKFDVQESMNYEKNQRDFENQSKGQLEDTQENLNYGNQTSQQSYQMMKKKKQIKQIHGNKVELVKEKKVQVLQSINEQDKTNEQIFQDLNMDNEINIDDKEDNHRLQITLQKQQRLSEENKKLENQEQNVKIENQHIQQIKKENKMQEFFQSDKLQQQKFKDQTLSKKISVQNQKISLKNKTQEIVVVESFSEQSVSQKKDQSQLTKNDSLALQQNEQQSFLNQQEKNDNKQYQFHQKEVQIVRHRVQSYQITQENKQKIIQNQYKEEKQYMQQSQQKFTGTLQDIHDQDFKLQDSQQKQLKRSKYQVKTNEGYIDNRMICKQLTKKIGNKVLKKQLFKKVTVVNKNGITFGQYEELARICIKQINRKSLQKLDRLQLEQSSGLNDTKKYNSLQALQISKSLTKKIMKRTLKKFEKLKSQNKKKDDSKISLSQKNETKTNIENQTSKGDTNIIQLSSQQFKEQVDNEVLLRNQQELIEKLRANHSHIDENLAKNFLKKINQKALKKWKFQKKFEVGKEVIDIEKILYGRQSIDETKDLKNQQRKESFQEVFKNTQDDYIKQQLNKNNSLQNQDQIKLDVNNLLSEQKNTVDQISIEGQEMQVNPVVNSKFRKRKKKKAKNIQQQQKNEKQIFNTERNVELIYSTVQIDYENVCEIADINYDEVIDIYPIQNILKSQKDKPNEKVKQFDQNIFEEEAKGRTLTFQDTQYKIQEQQKQRTITFQQTKQTLQSQQQYFLQEQNDNMFDSQDNVFDEEKSKGILSDDAIDEDDKKEHENFIFRNSFSGVQIFNLQNQNQFTINENNKEKPITQAVHIKEIKQKTFQQQENTNNKHTQQQILQEKEEKKIISKEQSKTSSQKSKKLKEYTSDSSKSKDKSSKSKMSKTSTESDFKKFVDEQINKGKQNKQVKFDEDYNQNNIRLERRVQTQKSTSTYTKSVSIKKRTYTVQEKKETTQTQEIKQQNSTQQQIFTQKQIKVQKNQIIQNNQETNFKQKFVNYQQTKTGFKKDSTSSQSSEQEQQKNHQQETFSINVQTDLQQKKVELSENLQENQKQNINSINIILEHEQKIENKQKIEDLKNQNLSLEIQEKEIDQSDINDDKNLQLYQNLKMQFLQNQPSSKYIYDPKTIYLRQNQQIVTNFDLDRWYDKVDKQQDDFKSRLDLINNKGEKQKHYLHQRTYEHDQKNLQKQNNINKEFKDKGSRGKISNFLNLKKTNKQQDTQIIQNQNAQKNLQQFKKQNNIIDIRNSDKYQKQQIENIIQKVQTQKVNINFRGLIKQSIEHQHIKTKDYQQLTSIRTKTLQQLCH